MLRHQTSGLPVFINLLISLAASSRKTNSAKFPFPPKPPSILPNAKRDITLHPWPPKLSIFHPFLCISSIRIIKQLIEIKTKVSCPLMQNSQTKQLLIISSRQPNSHSVATMKPKGLKLPKLKLLLLGCFLIFLILFLLLRSNSSFPVPQSTTQNKQISPSKALPTPSCTKIPHSLANTIIHYAASNMTPQQTFSEISVTARVLEKKSPCNFLVFGLGHDSPMWSALNHGGRTIFLEEDKAWMETIRQRFPTLESYHATYDTKVSQADHLLIKLRRDPDCIAVSDMKFSKCQLALKSLPSVFYEVEWDLIMVDAPTGWILEAPGRMGAIYTAGMAARARSEGETDVFVHDVDRVVEDKFSKTFLCEGYLKEQEGRLRHFTIPSHRTSLGMPFCP